MRIAAAALLHVLQGSDWLPKCKLPSRSRLSNNVHLACCPAVSTRPVVPISAQNLAARAPILLSGVGLIGGAAVALMDRLRS